MSSKQGLGAYSTLPKLIPQTYDEISEDKRLYELVFRFGFALAGSKAETPAQ